MDTLKILLVIESLSQGGAESLTVNLANALVSRGGDILLAASPGPLRDKLSTTVVFRELEHFSLLNAFGIFLELRRIISGFSPAVIHVQNGTHCLLIRLALLSMFQKVPVVFTHHSRRTSRIPNRLSGYVFNRIADTVVAISNARRSSMESSGIPPGKIVQIPNFINVASWRRNLDKFDRDAFLSSCGLKGLSSICLISARLIPAKNVSQFIGILSVLRRDGHNVGGIVLGDGPDLPALKAMADNHGLGERIHFAGFRNNIERYYFASDVFVLPSHWEVLPMAIIEAFSSGLPVVCSDIEGNNEIVTDGENGFCVKGDAAEYARHVSLIISSPELRKRLSDNALNTALSKYDEAICVDKTLAVYGFNKSF